MLLTLLGRYMLSDRHKYSCPTIDMSLGGIRITCTKIGAIGKRVVLYLEQIVCVLSAVARRAPGGLASASTRRRARVTSSPDWQTVTASACCKRRTHKRLVPTNPSVILKVEGHKKIAAHILDLSTPGVAVATSANIPVGTWVVVGSTPTKLVRQLEGGFGARFLLPISPNDSHEGIRL